MKTCSFLDHFYSPLQYFNTNIAQTRKTMGLLGISNRLITLLLLAGTTLLLILIVLSGAIKEYPINRFYWLQADTANITGAPPLTRWTFWGVCNSTGNDITQCDGLAPAAPISPVDNFGTTIGVPSDFISDRDTYYYLTRFSFCFFWISLAFIGISLILYVFSWCSLAFTKVVFLLVLVGSLLDIAAVSCQTAATVMGRNAFHDSGLSASIGASMLGIAWASVACCLILFFTTGATFIRRAYQSHKEYVQMQQYKEQALMYQGKQEALGINPETADSYNVPQDLEGGQVNAPDVTQPQESHHSGIKFFKIRRTQKNSDEESI